MKNSNDFENDTIETATQIHRSSMRLLRVLRALSDKNFSIAKMGVLTHLYRDGTSTATGLANYLKIRPQSVTRLLAELDKNGHIKRKPDETDRRQSLIEITPSGLELLLKEGRDQQEKLAKIMKNTLTESEKQILLVASKLMDDLSAGAESQFGEVWNKKKK